LQYLHEISVAPGTDSLPAGIWFSTSKEAAMKRTSMWCLGVLLSLGSAERLVAQGTRSTEEAVLRLEQQWFEVKVSCNPDLLGPLMADTVVITGSEPKLTNKAEALATCKNTKWERVRLTEMKLTVFGETVVATGNFSGEGTDASGKSFEVLERWTHTWVKMPSGQWQAAAIHTSPITMQAVQH
jgi:ketosteroid isomerase-like protein